MNNNELVPCCRRGLLAYVYNGVSDWMNTMNALVAGKWLLYSTALWPWPSRSDSTDTTALLVVSLFLHPGQDQGVPPPFPRGQADICENITLLYRSDAGGKNLK